MSISETREHSLIKRCRISGINEGQRWWFNIPINNFFSATEWPSSNVFLSFVSTKIVQEIITELHWFTLPMTSLWVASAQKVGLILEILLNRKKISINYTKSETLSFWHDLQSFKQQTKWTMKFIQILSTNELIIMENQKFVKKFLESSSIHVLRYYLVQPTKSEKYKKVLESYLWNPFFFSWRFFWLLSFFLFLIFLYFLCSSKLWNLLLIKFWSSFFSWTKRFQTLNLTVSTIVLYES